MKKYKALTKIKDINKLPYRIADFKGSKWNFLKKRLIKEARRKRRRFYKIKNTAEVFKLPGFWNKLSKTYKSKLLLKQKYAFVFETKMNQSFEKNKLVYLSQQFLPYYSPKYLLTLVFFAARKKESKYFLIRKNIFLNDSMLRHPETQLKRGDIINLKDSIDIKTNIKKYTPFLHYLSNVEVDAYSQQIAVLKNLEELSEEDIVNLNFENLNYLG